VQQGAAGRQALYRALSQGKNDWYTAIPEEVINNIINIIHAAIRGLEIRFITLSVGLEKSWHHKLMQIVVLNMGILGNIANLLKISACGFALDSVTLGHPRTDCVVGTSYRCGQTR
jgi:hypothetical protein